MNRFLFALLPLMVTACASPPASQTAAATSAEQDGVVCEQGSRTGSNMISKHCRSAAQRDQDKKEAAELGDKIRRTGPTGTGS